MHDALNNFLLSFPCCDFCSLLIFHLARFKSKTNSIQRPLSCNVYLVMGNPISIDSLILGYFMHEFIIIIIFYWVMMHD
jgi:hypothetical protein